MAMAEEVCQTELKLARKHFNSYGRQLILVDIALGVDRYIRVGRHSADY